jgi:FAD/FMN-containing dehydrogenase
MSSNHRIKDVPGNSNRLSGWGRIFAPGRSVTSCDLETDSRDAVLFRGLGRSYGDSALPPPSHPVVISTPLADKIRFFDRATGLFRAEAGLSLHEINRLFLREGWFVPVSPGTQFVTLGGMVASDVHGKNHHVDGCFGEHVEALKMRVADGRVLECSMTCEPELFRATIGGMGLTGHILEVEFRLRRIPSPWIWQESRRIGGIEEFVAALKSSARDWPFTVGWIDCLSQGQAMGRGILMCGRWASPTEAPASPPPFRHTLAVPFVFPEIALNPWTVRAFNYGYYNAHRAEVKRGIVHPETFFYPLDVVHEWNRIYGPRGFTQYQCVLPERGDCALTRRFFDLLTRLGGASFLCVIKDCGPEGRGMISFPMPGISIALDIPVRPGIQTMVNTLNDFVAEAGGRIYLTKDAFTRPEHFRAMDPRLESWLAVRRKWNPDGKIRSAQSVRLFGDPS